MLDAIVAAKKAGVPDAELQTAAALHRKAQETIDYARQGQLEAIRATPKR